MSANILDFNKKTPYVRESGDNKKENGHCYSKEEPPMDNDSRLARLEAQVENINSNVTEINNNIRRLGDSFHSLLFFVVATLLATATLFYVQLGKQDDVFNDKLLATEKVVTQKIDKVDQKIDFIQQGVNQKIDHNQQINDMKLEKVLDELGKIHKKLDDKMQK